MRSLASALALVSVVSAVSTAGAATLEVGPGQPYATPCAAIAAAQPGDTVEVAAATYTDTCAITAAGLTLRGVGGRPKIDLSSGIAPYGSKGIYDVAAENVTIDDLELTGAAISDADGANGAGLRIEAQTATVLRCFIHDNQDGILVTPPSPGGTFTIEYTELSHNGLGNGCNVGGCTHNIYVNEVAKLVFQFNWSHDIGTDGHLLKSRADESDVLYNRLTGETGTESYEIDLPNGGLGIVVGNSIEKSPTAHNPTLVSYGEEGLARASTQLVVVNNTFVNDFTSGTFLSLASGATLTAHDNLFVGPGTIASTGALSSDNLSGVDPLFADRATFDYHLTAGSPAIGKAVAPGSAGSFSLTPLFEYVQPLQSVPRRSDGDLGAFEFGTNLAGAGQDGGGTPAPDDAGAVSPAEDGGSVGVGGSQDGGTPVGADAGVNGASGGAGASGGCGCHAGRFDLGEGAGALVLAAGLLLAWRSRARRARVTRVP